MRAVRCTAAGLCVASLTPAAGPGEVRVRTAAAGISASDLHLVAMGPMAATLGHEFGGLLDDGTPVAVRPSLPCGTCAACAGGLPEVCGAAAERMYGVSLDGGMADEVWVDPSCVVPLPHGLAPADAALVEPLAVAAHGVSRVGIVGGQRVLVVGGGPIGLCTIAAARALGASVDVEAHRESRQAAASRLGARVGASGRYDVVIDAAGTASSAATAARRATPGGVVGLVGTWWEPVALDIAWQMKQVTLVPAFVYSPERFAAAATLLASVPDLPDVLVTHRFGLDDAVEAFRVAGDRAEDAIKVVLEP